MLQPVPEEGREIGYEVALDFVKLHRMEFMEEYRQPRPRGCTALLSPPTAKFHVQQHGNHFDVPMNLADGGAERLVNLFTTGNLRDDIHVQMALLETFPRELQLYFERHVDQK